MIIYWIITFTSVSIVTVFFQRIKHKKRAVNLKLKIKGGLFIREVEGLLDAVSSVNLSKKKMKQLSIIQFSLTWVAFPEFCTD